MSRTEFSVSMPTRPEDLEILRDEWNALGLHQRSPTHRVEWAQASLESLWRPDSGPLRLFQLRRDGRLSALALLRERREWGSVYLEDLGTREMQEPTDLLYASREDLRLLLDGLVGTGWPFVLCRLPEESQVPQVLAECLRGRGRMRCIEGRSYPAVDLIAHPEGELNAGRRSDLRRMRRRAEKQGPLRVELGCPAVEEVPRLLELAVEIESRSWKLETPHALKHNPKTLGFLRRLLPRAAASGILRLAFMYLGERPVAMQIAVESGGGYWLLKIGYDAELGSMAPGQLLMWDTLQACTAAGLRSYELWGHSDEWTRMWTRREMASHCVEAYPAGLRSARRLAALALRKIVWLVRAKLTGRRDEI